MDAAGAAGAAGAADAAGAAGAAEVARHLERQHLACTLLPSAVAGGLHVTSRVLACGWPTRGNDRVGCVCAAAVRQL